MPYGMYNTGCHVEYRCEQNSDPCRNVILFGFNNYNVHDCTVLITNADRVSPTYVAGCIGIRLERSKPPKHTIYAGQVQRGRVRKTKARLKSK